MVFCISLTGIAVVSGVACIVAVAGDVIVVAGIDVGIDAGTDAGIDPAIGGVVIGPVAGVIVIVFVSSTSDDAL